MIDACAAAAGVPLRTLLAIGPRRGPDRRLAAGRRPTGTTPGIRFRTAAAWPPRAGARGRGRVRRRRSAARAAVRRRLGADGAAGDGDSARRDKQRTARTLMEQGADIHELNTVRKHLSAIKGGQLALAARGTRADARGVRRRWRRPVGDRLRADGAGRQHVCAPALDVLARRGGSPLLSRGRSSIGWRAAPPGDVPETPTRGDPRLSRARARVIGPQRGAIDGASARPRRSAITCTWSPSRSPARRARRRGRHVERTVRRGRVDAAAACA